MIDKLPEDCQHTVLRLLSSQDVLQRVALVSRSFRNVAFSDSYWLSRLPPMLAAALRQSASSASVPLRPHQLFCTLYNTNLLLNPWFCLEEQMVQRRSRGVDVAPRAKTPWLAGEHGYGWRWEGTEPEGLNGPGPHNDPTDAVPPMPPPPLPPFNRQAGPSWRPAGAVASSYYWVQLVQEVDLVEELLLRGLTREAACTFLDSSPPLLFQVYVAGRFDCAGWFEASVVLDDGRAAVPLRPEQRQRWLEGSIAAASTGEESAQPMVWQGQSLRLEGYGAGARRAVVILRAKDQNFWDGHFGNKFAAPCLRFMAPGPRS